MRKLRIPRNLISIRSEEDLTRQLDAALQVIENFISEQHAVYVRLSFKEPQPTDLRRGDLVFTIPPGDESGSIQYFDGKNLQPFNLSALGGSVTVDQLPSEITALIDTVAGLVIDVGDLTDAVVTLQEIVADLVARPNVPLTASYNGIDVSFLWATDLTDFLYPSHP